MPSIHSVKNLTKAYNRDGDTKHLMALLMKFAVVDSRFINPKLLSEVDVTDGFVNIKEVISLDKNIVMAKLYEEQKKSIETIELRRHHKPSKDIDYD